MKRVNRADLLRRLESVQSAVENKGGEMQSDCFVFKDDRVYTYNGEISASYDTGLGDEIYGAVRAEKLVKVLKCMGKEEIELEGAENTLTLRHGKEELVFPMESAIALPFDSIEPPEVWKQLPDHFLEAIDVVQAVAEDKAIPELWKTTLVHVSAKWVEAMTTVEAIRYRLKTPLVSPMMFRKIAIKHIVALGVTEFGETKAWTHFRNQDGMVYSCLCFADAYPSEDVTEVLSAEDGSVAVLPIGLAEVVERAALIADNAKAQIELTAGRMRVRAQGARGEKYDSGRIKVVYDGPDINFLMSPKLLGELSAEHSEVHVSEKLMKVYGQQGWKYATGLSGVSEAKETVQEDEE